MKNKEIIDLLIAYENGKTILSQNKCTENPHNWFKVCPKSIYSNPEWDFSTKIYRIKPEIKERFLTVKELWGKTLITKDEQTFIVASAIGDNINIHIRGSYSYVATVAKLHDTGWKLATNDLTYETATSLKIETT